MPGRSVSSEADVVPAWRQQRRRNSRRRRVLRAGWRWGGRPGSRTSADRCRLVHATASLRLLVGHDLLAEGREREKGELEVLHSERDGDDRDAEEKAGDHVDDRDVPCLLYTS